MLKQRPERVRLVFSEELEIPLATVSLKDAGGRVIHLKVSGDPHDVHALILGRAITGLQAFS